MRWWRPQRPSLVLGGVAITIALAACSPETASVSGEFVLLTGVEGPRFGDCYGTGGFDEIREGLQVTLRDGSGSLIATSRLGVGQLSVPSRVSSPCVFEFELPDIPRLEFYVFEVGGRGELIYSHEEMVAQEWEVNFSLG